MLCHSERSEDELLRTLSEKSEYINIAFQILRDAQDDILTGKNQERALQ